MRKGHLLCLGVLLLAPLLPVRPEAQAGAPYLGYAWGDVIVATVTKVTDHKATNGNPPRVELEVHEVLRGNPATERKTAVWAPFPFDFDVPQSLEAHKKWLTQPMTGPLPKVGDKIIAWGSFENTGDGKRFVLMGHACFPYSAENRKKAVQLIQEEAKRVRDGKIQAEAERKKLLAARAQWRAKVSAEDLEKYVAEADFIGVGKIVSESFGPDFATRVTPTFETKVILKGDKKVAAWKDTYFATVPLPTEVHALLDRETTYVVFLSEKGLKITPSQVLYSPIGKGDGIVIADEACLKAVREALKKAKD